MKKIILLSLFATLFSVFAMAQTKGAQFKFKDKDNSHSFGTVKEGDNATHIFEFTNIGDAPLIIQNAEASCGCTTPDWPKQPILPGKKGSVTVKYDTKNRVGPINRSVFIKSNATNADKNGRTEVKILGTVVEG